MSAAGNTMLLAYEDVLMGHITRLLGFGCHDQWLLYGDAAFDAQQEVVDEVIVEHQRVCDKA